MEHLVHRRRPLSAFTHGCPFSVTNWNSAATEIGLNERTTTNLLLISASWTSAAMSRCTSRSSSCSVTISALVVTNPSFQGFCELVALVARYCFAPIFIIPTTLKKTISTCRSQDVNGCPIYLMPSGTLSLVD